MGRRTIVLIIAVVLAVVSAFAVWRYLTTVEDDIKADITEVQVYRAAEFVDTATTGEDAQPFIESSTALREYVVFEGSTVICTGAADRNEGQDPTLVGCPENPNNLDIILDGRVAAGPISAGQVITTDMFVTPAELNSISLSESIPQGKVAISIRPEETGAVGGFIRPGDNVNIVASASIPINGFVQLLQDPELREAILGSGFAQPEAQQAGGIDGDIGTVPGSDEEFDAVSNLAQTLPTQLDFTQTILQDLEVLAVGEDTRPSPIGTGLLPQGTQLVVLEVTPEQAEQIEYARQYTTVSLMLLPKDLPYSPFDSRGVLVDDIFDLIDRIQEQVEEQVEGAIGSSGT
jgi:Flp pilus assembly protein CpaB